MYNDYNRYTFFPAHLHWFYDDEKYLVVAYYDPNPVYANSDDFKLKIVSSPIRTKYTVKQNYLINKIDNTLSIEDPESKECTIGELEDIQNAYRDQYGKELDVVKKIYVDMMPAE